MEDNSSKKDIGQDPTLHNILVEQGGIRTYQKDQSVALSGEQGALVKETIQKERDKEKLITTQTLNAIKNKVFLILSLVFFVGTVGVFIYTYTIYKKDNVVVVQTIQKLPLISFENELPSVALPTTKELLASYIGENISKLKDEENSTLRFTFGENNTINTQTAELLSLFNEKQKNTWETLNLGDFEIGLIYKNNMTSKFILIKTDGSDDAYKKFSSWEETISTDIAPIFSISETTLNNKKSTWKDSLYENINFKTYTDENGKVLLIKGFLNSKVFVITDNPDSILYLLSLIRLEHRRDLVQ